MKKKDNAVVSSSSSPSQLLERSEIESDPNGQQQEQQDGDGDEMLLSSQIQNLNLSSPSSSSPAAAVAAATTLTTLPPAFKQVKQNQRTALICDAWYGFPLQKRPRQERLLAVSRQICNFILWNEGYQSSMTSKTTSAMNNKRQGQDDSMGKHKKREEQQQKLPASTLYVIGKVEDVNSIESRIKQLLTQHRQQRKQIKSSSSMNDDEDTAAVAANHGENITNDNNDEDGDGDSYYCQYLPGMTLEKLCEELISFQQPKGTNSQEKEALQLHQANGITDICNRTPNFRDEIVYLSPDASNTLNPKEPPPSIVVIGMLVDRKVQPNRSKTRAEQIVMKQRVSEEKCKVEEAQVVQLPPSFSKTMSQVSFNCSRLPLDSLNVSDLGSDEALNIDTVMEMMQRWYYNCYLASISQSEPQSQQQQQPQEGEDVARQQVKSGSIVRDCDGACTMTSKQCFKDAAARALLTHRNRHPKRIIHGSKLVSKS